MPDPVFSKQQIENVRFYLEIMAEVKVRLKLINSVYTNRDDFAAYVVREQCYLQFRFLCELIGLGCLVAHGDIDKAKIAKEHYEPGVILKRLEKQKDDIFPWAAEQRNQDGQVSLHFDQDKVQLKKDEVAKLWGIAGDVLHRGPLVKMQKKFSRYPSDFSDIFEWSGKITGLLNSHWLSVVEGKIGLLVSLATAPAGEARASLIRIDDPPRLIWLDVFHKQA